MVDLLEELLQTDRLFSETSINEGAVEAYKKFLASDATFLPNRRGPFHGVDSICEAIQIPGVEYSLTWVPESGKVSDSGDMGYTWDNYELTYPSDGKVETEKGKYLNVWSRQTDGSWKVIIDMGNLS